MLSQQTLQDYLETFNRLSTAECMIFNQWEGGKGAWLAEKSPCETGGYNGPLGELADTVNNIMTAEEKDQLATFVNENSDKKRFGGRPCEVR